MEVVKTNQTQMPSFPTLKSFGRYSAVPILTGLLFVSVGPARSHAADATSPPAVETKITDDGFPKRDPVFWPGGEEIVYAVEAETGHMRIVRRSLSDGTVTLFDEQPNRSDREMSVSADGSVYAFNVVSGLSSKIHVVDKVRNKRLTMPKMGKKTWSNWPSVSPDGTRVVFSEGASVLYSFDLRTANGRQSVTRLSPQGSRTASDYWPHFSPDGESIVFTTNRDEDFEIYVMNSDGSVQLRLTESRGIDMHPRWSPDGKRIAFTSNRDGNYEIYLMNADGSGQARVTTNAERDDYVCWSLAGDALVFVSERDGRFDLYRREVR